MITADMQNRGVTYSVGYMVYTDTSHMLLVLQNEVHDLRHNSSGNGASPRHKMYGESYGAEGLQESFTPVQSYHGAPLTGQHTT